MQEAHLTQFCVHQAISHSTHRKPRPQASRIRRGATLLALSLISLGVPSADASHPAKPETKHSIRSFRNDMPRTIRADHPAILPVAAAIRAVTPNPLEQLVMVNDVTHLLVDYDDDQRVYGRAEYHATLDEMLETRRARGWLYLRDDCDGRAVFAAHLLASLGIAWRLEASNLKGHAWVSAQVNGVTYDMLDFMPTDHSKNSLAVKLFTRRTQRPPSFSWRRQWAAVTHRDVNIGLQLGMLTLDSTASKQRERRSRDWTLVAPGGLTPTSDDRAYANAPAGFPYGERVALATPATASAANSLASQAGQPSATTAPLASSSATLRGK